VSILDPPIGFVSLRDALDIVARKIGDADRAMMMIAELCAAGEIAATYRSWTGGADDLPRDKWLSPYWRSYFDAGTIELDLPLVDDRGQAHPQGITARCIREIFIKRQDLDRTTLPLVSIKARVPGDAELVQQGLDAIAEGRATNPFQAAKLICGRIAKAQQIDRIRKLIAKHRQTSPRTP